MMTKTKTRWKRDTTRTQSFILYPRTALRKCISTVLLLLICSFSVEHLSPLKSTGTILMLRLREMSVGNIKTVARVKQRPLWQGFFVGDVWDWDSRQQATWSYMQSLRKCSERTQGTTRNAIHFIQKQWDRTRLRAARRTPLLRPYHPQHSSMICSV